MASRSFGRLAAASVLAVAAGTSHAAVTTEVYYRLGEDDGATTVGGVGENPTQDSSANDRDAARTGSPVYAAGVAPGSTRSVDFLDGANQYSRAAFNVTDNFGLESFFQVDTIDRQVFYANGTGGGDGVGFFLGNDGTGATPAIDPAEYQGIYGNVSFLRTGIDAVAGDTVYMAVVENAGATNVYISVKPLNGSFGPLQTFSFNVPSPRTPVGTFSLNTNNTFDGRIDEARFFTFAPGQFSTNDLLFNTVPEPGSLSLLSLGAVAVLRRRR